MTSIIYIIVAIVLYMVICAALNNASFFQDAHPGVMSICVTALCVIGMHQIFGKSEFNSILLPYAVLGVALLSILLLQWLPKPRNSRNASHKKKMTKKK